MSKKFLFITIGVIVIIGAIAVIIVNKRANGVPYELVTLQKGSIVQEVSASGKVESPTQIDLHFKNNGKLIVVNTKVGKKVVTGQLLAKQDSAQLDAQILETQTGIDLQKAKLNQLLSGASLEDVGVSEIEVLNAEQALENAKKNLIDKIKNIYTKSDDAIRGKSDQLFSNSKSSNPQLIIIASDLQLETDVEFQRLILERVLVEWVESLNIISKQSDLSSAIVITNENIDLIKLFLNKMALIVNALTANSSFSQTTIDKWKIDISTARANVDVAASNFLSAEENIKTKESVLKTAKGQLALKKSPARSSDIAVYQAQINQAEASLQKIQVQKEDLIIFAPLSGTITEVNSEVGETVGPDKTIFSLATGGALQIKLNVVEDNIVNVRVGQEAKITFDAIEEQEFLGSVTAIDPAETIVGGAVYYQTTILFEKKDEHIRSGMTANVWIKTSISENTLFVPASAVQNSGGKKMVQVLEGKQVVEKEITTGIKNDIGMIEITSGLSEGEKVIIGNKKERNKK